MCSCKNNLATEQEFEAAGTPVSDRTGRMLLSLAEAAARARNRSTAARSFARLIRLVRSRVSPKVQRNFGRRTMQEFEIVVKTATPALARAGVRAARCLFRDRRLRRNVRLLPVIVQRTLMAIARRLSHGHTVTPRTAVRILARQAGTCLERGCDEIRAGHFRTARGLGEGEMEVANSGACLQTCERQFQECLNPPWWQFWKGTDATQCLANRQACLRSCQPVSAKGCGEGICEGQGCEACCQFHCPNNLSECMRLCSPYR